MLLFVVAGNWNHLSCQMHAAANINMKMKMRNGRPNLWNSVFVVCVADGHQSIIVHVSSTRTCMLCAFQFSALRFNLHLLQIQIDFGFNWIWMSRQIEPVDASALPAHNLNASPLRHISEHRSSECNEIFAFDSNATFIARYSRWQSGQCFGSVHLISCAENVTMRTAIRWVTVLLQK